MSIDIANIATKLVTACINSWKEMIPEVETKSAGEIIAEILPGLLQGGTIKMMLIPLFKVNYEYYKFTLNNAELLSERFGGDKFVNIFTSISYEYQIAYDYLHLSIISNNYTVHMRGHDQNGIGNMTTLEDIVYEIGTKNKQIPFRFEE